jgi:HSP20 family protein
MVNNINTIGFKNGELLKNPHNWVRLMDEIFDADFKNTGWFPPVDFYETDNGYEMQVMLPGFSKEDIRIELEENKLRISGERKTEETKAKVLLKESRQGRFVRTFSLAKDVNPEAVEANFENGILYIKLQKSEKALNRVIEIK